MDNVYKIKPMISLKIDINIHKFTKSYVRPSDLNKANLYNIIAEVFLIIISNYKIFENPECFVSEISPISLSDEVNYNFKLNFTWEKLFQADTSKKFEMFNNEFYKLNGFAKLLQNLFTNHRIEILKETNEYLRNYKKVFKQTYKIQNLICSVESEPMISNNVENYI